MEYVRARVRSAGRSAIVVVGLLTVVAAFVGSGSAAAVDPVPTTTRLVMNADGTGTVTVVTADGSAPANPVDLWVDSTWLQTFTLPSGETGIDVGPQAPGDHRITVRYRNNATHAASQASVMWTAPGTVQVPTTTSLQLNPDGTGTIKVTAASGPTPANPVDLWVDSTWQRAYTLTNGQAAVDLGKQALGDHKVTVRHRPSSTSGASQVTVPWTAPGTVQVPTTTSLQLNPDGTGTIKVTAASGPTPANPVDLWVDSTWQRAYTLTNGQAAVDLGKQALGDHKVTVRHRPSSTSGASQVTVPWTAPGTVQVPTTTSLQLNPDGTGTIKVTAASGPTPANPVDLWVDSTWQRAYTLTNGQAAVDLGKQALGDHKVTVRHRPSTTSGASQASLIWTAPGTVQVPTTTTLDLGPDGTGTITVTATTPTTLANPVDLWIDSTWQRAYTLTDGRATFDLGPQPGGDHRVTVRYRPSSTSGASQASVPWSVTTDDQVPTTTTLSVLPDGTATIEVVVADGSTATNPVDLWVDGRAQTTHTLTDGRATVALGSRAGGILGVKVRYRPSATHLASTATAVWSVDTSPVPAAGACGEAVLKADGTPWTCTFADDFDGTTLDRARWNVQTIFASGHEDSVVCYVDSPDNVAVSDGALHLTVRKGEATACEGQGGLVTPYTSGMVTTAHRWSQQYGRFEARAKTTATTSPGLHEAFWLWPDDRYPEGQQEWPANGEIDVAETYSSFSDLVVPYLHSALDTLGAVLTGSDANTTWSCTAPRGEFNTYTLEWSPERIEIFVNGRSCLVNTSGDEAFKKRYIMALTQALGSQTGNTLVDGTPIPATMTVDYVRAWS